MKYLETTARIVGPHRYTLERRWSAVGLAEPRIVWIMLNPSTAGAEVDDPTVRKVVGFSKRWRSGWRTGPPATWVRLDSPSTIHSKAIWQSLIMVDKTTVQAPVTSRGAR